MKDPNIMHFNFESQNASFIKEENTDDNLVKYENADVDIFL